MKYLKLFENFDSGELPVADVYKNTVVVWDYQEFPDHKTGYLVSLNKGNRTITLKDENGQEHKVSLETPIHTIDPKSLLRLPQEQVGDHYFGESNPNFDDDVHAGSVPDRF